MHSGELNFGLIELLKVKKYMSDSDINGTVKASIKRLFNSKRQIKDII